MTAGLRLYKRVGGQRRPVGGGKADATVVRPGPALNVKVTYLGGTNSIGLLEFTPPDPVVGVTIIGYRVARDGYDQRGSGPYSTMLDPTARSFEFWRLTVDSVYNLSVAAIGDTGVGPTTTIPLTATVDTGGGGGGAGTTVGSRNVRTQPFSSASIWNTPIGDKAVLKHAGIGTTPASGRPYSNANGGPGDSFKVVIDPIRICMDTSQPKKILSEINQAGGRTEIPNYDIPDLTEVHVPPDMAHNGSWNGICALIRPGGLTYVEGQTLFLEAGGNPRWCFTNAKTVDSDLKGDGRIGAHGGARMSGLGGAIRKSEWEDPSKPLRHVLSINLFGHRFISRAVHPQGGGATGGNGRGGWRWPAYTSDRGYNSSTSHNYYALTDPDKPMMGALLCIPRGDAIFDTLTHPKAKWLAEGLRDMGAYVVDNTAWDAHAFSMNKAVQSSFNAETSTFHKEVMSLFTRLHVVISNSPTSVGGGGNPIVAPPPPPA